MTRQSTEDLQVDETSLYDTINVGTYNYIFGKPIEYTKREPKCKLWIWANNEMICQCKFINCSTLMWDVCSGRRILHVWGKGYIGILRNFHLIQLRT